MAPPSSRSLSSGPDLAQVDDVVAQQRLDPVGEELPLGGLADLGGDEQPPADRPHGPGGVVDAFVGHDPPEEQEVGPAVVAGAVAQRVGVEVEAVVDDGGDGEVRAGAPGLVAADGDHRDLRREHPVQVDEVAVERPVVGGDDRRGLMAGGAASA